MHETCSMNTPMGPQNGSLAVAATLNMFATMGAKPEMPVEEDGEIFSRSDSPMGKVRIIYTLTEGLISRIETKMGG